MSMKPLSAARDQVLTLTSKLSDRTLDLEAADQGKHFDAVQRLRDGKVSPNNVADLEALAKADRARAAEFRTVMADPAEIARRTEWARQYTENEPKVTPYHTSLMYSGLKDQAERYEETAALTDSLVSAVKEQLAAQPNSMTWFETAKDTTNDVKNAALAVADALTGKKS